MPRADLLICIFGSLLFFIVGVLISPPNIESLQVSNAKVVATNPTHVKEIVKFADEDGHTLECIAQGRVRWKCPYKELVEAYKNNEQLVLWHDQKTVYQIKQGDKFLLKYSRYQLESNFAFGAALFWFVLLIYVNKRGSPRSRAQ
ncbi:hypothetical protein SKTS_03430 [Sulfurimicrobium lacus]|uniref:Uncharacterized protein n=1 Tax=Sulfurimicrobium lacus TaxID=2715678 RepID=A0A6F8V8L2_9PROT|nr:hypothetical protein [Sulfurimicrobium lacus]BCB25457.1 hypothetical protein SKTS_03430 [Sulfurimicrobium lacus]